MLRLAEFPSDVGMKRLELIEEAVPRAARGAFGSANLLGFSHRLAGGRRARDSRPGAAGRDLGS